MAGERPFDGELGIDALGTVWCRSPSSDDSLGLLMLGKVPADRYLCAL